MSITNLSLRRARPDDAAAIAQVHVASWQTTYRGLIPNEVIDSFTVSVRTERWQRILGEPAKNAATFVAIAAEAALAGFISVGPSKEPLAHTPGQIYALYLLPNHQGRGLGRWLMTRAVGFLAEHRLIPFQARAVLGNTRARQAYAAWGGEEVALADFAIAGTPLQHWIYRFPTVGTFHRSMVG